MAPPAYSSWSPVMSLLVISVLLHPAIAPAAPAPEQPSPHPAAGCVNELVMFSPCLAFVSSPPNNLSGSVSSKCCDAFSTAFYSGEGSCFCYLLRQPLMLGFPLNVSRVLSLPSLCAQTNRSLESLCSGSDFEALSPDSRISNPPDSAPSSQPSPSAGFPPESNNSPTPLSSPPDSSPSGTKSSLLPQPANRLPTRPISPVVDPLLLSPAVASRLKNSRFGLKTSILIFPFLILTCL